MLTSSEMVYLSQTWNTGFMYFFLVVFTWRLVIAPMDMDISMLINFIMVYSLTAMEFLTLHYKWWLTWKYYLLPEPPRSPLFFYIIEKFPYTPWLLYVLVFYFVEMFAFLMFFFYIPMHSDFLNYADWLIYYVIFGFHCTMAGDSIVRGVFLIITVVMSSHRPPVPRIEPISPPALDEHAFELSTIPSRTSINEENMCCICHQPYEPHDKIWTLPCTHKGHQMCYEIWLRRKGTCPICRLTVTPAV